MLFQPVMLLGNLLLVATVTTIHVKGQWADRHTQAYRFQHDQCSHTILLPQLPPCSSRSTASEASGSTQNQLPTIQLVPLSGDLLNRLKNALRDSTQTPQKIKEQILIILRPELEQAPQNPVENHTGLVPERDTGLRNQTLAQTQNLTNIEDQNLNQKTCMEVQMLEILMNTHNLEKELAKQSHELNQLHGCNSILQAQLLALKVQKKSQLTRVRSFKGRLPQLLKYQICNSASIQHRLQAGSSTSSLPQLKQYELLEHPQSPLSPEQARGAAQLVFWDCEEVRRSGVNVDGVYTILVPNLKETKRVFCVMDNDGGAWTLIQRRVNGTENFQRNWQDYKEGFGDPAGEHWLGNEAVHQLTSRTMYSLRVEVEDWEGNTAYANFGHFQLESEEKFYRIFLSKHSGAALGRGHRVLKDSKFSTRDADHDNCYCNCAEMMSGGWWFDRCGASNLNGIYYPEGQHLGQTNGIFWHYSVHRPHYSFRASRMMMRPLRTVTQPLDS